MCKQRETTNIATSQTDPYGTVITDDDAAYSEKDKLQANLDEQRDTVREQVTDILADKLDEMRKSAYIPKWFYNIAENDTVTKDVTT